MNLNQLFESLSADQRRAGQLPADFRPPNTSPQLSGPYPGRNATRGYLVGESVRVVDQDYDLDQIILTMDINGRPVSFTYTDYNEDFDNAERGDVHDQLQRNDWYAALSHPDRMEILDAAYRAIRGLEPQPYQPSVGLEPMDVGDRLDEQGVAEGRADSANPLQRTIDFAVKNGYQVKTSPKRTRATFINRDIDHEIRATLYREQGDDMIWVNFDDRTSGMSGNDPADEFYDTFVRAYQDAAQDVSAGHADQQRKIFKYNGRPVGEVGIDRESSPGVGQYYMKHYASGTDNSGYDSFEEAVEELRHLAKQGVAEAMKPSDIPPSMRQRLSMRDIERERPQGAFRFRVTFPDGHANDYMTFDAAKSAAERAKGRITRLSEDKKKSNPRIERILRQLRARHPQAEDDLEALIYDFRGQQAQDRTDIARLDRENDMEEADIERLEQMLDIIRQRRGADTVATESLRDGEYHLATVTLDDGTKKKIRITTDEGFRDRIQQHFQKQGHTVREIDVDYAVRSDLGEEKPRFVGAPARPTPAPITHTKTLPPAPGRPRMVGGPRDQQRDLEQDLARRMAAEDVLGDVKRRLGDVLKQREQRRAERMPAKQMPQDVLGDPVKKIDLGNGKVLMIHGNEDDGFRIHLGQRVMPTRFATMEQAEMATRMYEAKRDACYNKVKSRYKVWPSAYASGALVQCRKQGAANWGTKKK